MIIRECLVYCTIVSNDYHPNPYHNIRHRSCTTPTLAALSTRSLIVYPIF